MLLSDIFIDEADINNVIKEYIKMNMNYYITDDMIEAGVKEALKSNIFYFDEYGICIKFEPAGVKIDDYQKWVYIPFEEFGIENVSLFN